MPKINPNLEECTNCGRTYSTEDYISCPYCSFDREDNDPSLESLTIFDEDFDINDEIV